jgi:hypothetical protein
MGKESSMRVKIGNTIYNPNDQPILILLTRKDRQNIANMSPTATKYLCCPDTMTDEEIADFIVKKELEDLGSLLLP